MAYTSPNHRRRRETDSCCSARCTLIFVIILQILVVLQRLVFDFLGAVWGLILSNFLHLLLVVVGLFGVLHYRPRLLGLYIFWLLLWMAWNAFVLCIFQEFGMLKRDIEILDLGLGQKSWWYKNGPNCTVTGSPSSRSGTLSWLEGEDKARIEGCLLPYYHIESGQAGLQILLALLAFILGCAVLHDYVTEDDSFDFIGGFDTYSAYQSPTKTSHMQLQPIYAAGNLR